MATRRQTAMVRHDQLELALSVGPVLSAVAPILPPVSPEHPDEAANVAFMLRSMCIDGMPHRRGSDKVDGSAAEFKRRGPNVVLRLLTPHFDIPDDNQVVQIGVPFGAKARLLVLWMASQARFTLTADQRWIEIGPIKDWLAEIGIRNTGPTHGETKEQLIRLCHTIFQISATRLGDKDIAWKRELLVERGIVGEDDMRHYGAGQIDKIRWPTATQLTASAFKRFNDETIPVPAHRLREIAHSSSAINMFLYLCYRLPEIRPGASELATWKQMSQQFGSLGPDFTAREYKPAKLRELLSPAVKLALNAYPEARVEDTGEVIVFHHSDPAVLRRAYINGATLPTIGQTKVRKRRSNLQVEDGSMSG